MAYIGEQSPVDRRFDGIMRRVDAATEQVNKGLAAVKTKNLEVAAVAFKANGNQEKAKQVFPQPRTNRRRP